MRTMGLDNGITIRKVKKEDIPYFVKYEDMSEYEKEPTFEIAYWRKCWGIRQAIADVLHSDAEYVDADIDREDIPALIEALVPFLGKDYWDENADSIWEYDEQVANTRKVLINLFWLYTYMADHDVEVHFYDSY